MMHPTRSPILNQGFKSNVPGERTIDINLKDRRTSFMKQGKNTLMQPPKSPSIQLPPRLNDNLSQMRQGRNPKEGEFMAIEEYDAAIDEDFVKQRLRPYLSDLYKDLLMRSNQSDSVDKVSFIEYTQLPGIINDRFHCLFS